MCVRSTDYNPRPNQYRRYCLYPVYEGSNLVTLGHAIARKPPDKVMREVIWDPTFELYQARQAPRQLATG